MSSPIPTTTESLSSFQCSSSQQSNAEKNIVFTDGTMTFHDSWTCHIQNCTLRQRIIQCNSQKSDCILNWSCQQCIYGGSTLQCKICHDRCISSICFKKCYSYLCSDSLRAYQCYYQSEYCYITHQKSLQSINNKQTNKKPLLSEYSLESISQNCRQCALDDQDVDACYFCFNACSDHTCWNNCSINSNFDLYAVSISKKLTFHHANYSNITAANPTPILLTPNAIYGIMAMIGLICLIFGFWIGKNCSAHSLLSRACCKMCVFWCDDDKYNDLDDYEEESAWNWKSTHSSSTISKKHRKKTKKYGGSMDLSRESLNDSGHAVIPINNIKINANNKLPLNKTHINNYNSTSNNNNNRIGRDLQMRFPMTPLSSRELPRQQNVEQSPDVRVAHFSTPLANEKNDNMATFFDGDNTYNFQMDRMKSIGSDEEDAPETTNFYDIDSKIKKRNSKRKKKNNSNINNISLNRNDSFDGFALTQKYDDGNKLPEEKSISHKIYSKDDMIVTSGNEYDDSFNINDNGNDNNNNDLNSNKLLFSEKQKRAISTGGLSHLRMNKRRRNKQIIVLNSSKTRSKVVSPPPIKSKSEFQMLLRPTMSADAIALKRNKK